MGKEVTAVPLDLEERNHLRWDVLNDLHESLTGLAEIALDLRDNLTPKATSIVDAEFEASYVRRTFELLDKLGWYSPEQQANSNGKVAA